MASGYSPWFYRKVLYRIPGLFKVCPGGNYHWFYDRLCFCRMGEHIALEWHGGIYDFKTGEEYQECDQCKIEKEAKREDQLNLFNCGYGTTNKNPCKGVKEIEDLVNSYDKLFLKQLKEKWEGK